MATTSIWRVNGWLGKVVIYVENPDKTENPAFFEKANMTAQQAQELEDVIEYAVNSKKTQMEESGEILHQFVSGVNCSPSTAREEMMAVKRRFGKETGTVAYHGYQSFAPGEATPEIVHEIGVKLAQQLWGDRYQVLVATHLDKANHLHNHFLLNTVSFVDGKKFYRSEQDYRQMRAASDQLCREYGLSVIEKGEPGKSKQYAEWKAEQEHRPTWRGLIRADVDDAIQQSMTERQFFAALRSKYYEVKIGKDISIRPPGKERFFRLTRNFGEDYTLENIRRRILAHGRPERSLPEPDPPKEKYRVQGHWKPAKATGFRALYFHYCYLFGVFSRQKPQQPQKLHPLLRDELLKLERISKEARLLARCHIDTDEQLFAYKAAIEEQMQTMTADRKELYRVQRTVAVKADPEKLAEVKNQIASMSKMLGALREEVRLCDDIAARSGVMLEKLNTVREDEKTRRREEYRNEHIRRRGGTGRSYEPGGDRGRAEADRLRGEEYRRRHLSGMEGPG